MVPHPVTTAGGCFVTQGGARWPCNSCCTLLGLCVAGMGCDSLLDSFLSGAGGLMCGFKNAGFLLAPAAVRDAESKLGD